MGIQGTRAYHVECDVDDCIEDQEGTLEQLERAGWRTVTISGDPVILCINHAPKGAAGLDTVAP